MLALNESLFPKTASRALVTLYRVSNRTNKSTYILNCEKKKGNEKGKQKKEKAKHRYP